MLHICSRMWLINSAKAMILIHYPLFPISDPSPNLLPHLLPSSGNCTSTWIEVWIWYTQSKDEHSSDRLRQAAATGQCELRFAFTCTGESQWRSEKGNSVVPDGEQGFHLGDLFSLRNWPCLERKIYFPSAGVQDRALLLSPVDSAWLGEAMRGIIRLGRKQVRAIGSKLFRHRRQIS